MRNSPEVLGDAVLEMVHVMANTLSPASALEFYDRIADECRSAARTVDGILMDERSGYSRPRPLPASRSTFGWPLQDERGPSSFGRPGPARSTFGSPLRDQLSGFARPRSVVGRGSRNRRVPSPTVGS